MITKDEVKYIAKLARLDLSEAEIKKYQKQLAKILDYVDQLKKTKTGSAKPVTGETDSINIFRLDEAKLRDEKQTEKLIQSAPEREKGMIKTKKIFYEF